MSQALATPRFQLATRAASARPASYRDADRSIEAVAATETPVQTWIYDYTTRQSYLYDEVFDISGMTDAEVQGIVGCPILDSHSTWSTLAIVGVIIEARRENENRDLIVRFSIDETETIIASKVKSGTIRKVSLGCCRKASGATITEREGQIPLRRTPIDVCELSLVAVPADPNTGTRSGHQHLTIRDIADPAVTQDQDDSMNRDAMRSAFTAFSTSFLAAIDETPVVVDPAAAAAAAAEATRAAAALEATRAAANLALPGAPDTAAIAAAAAAEATRAAAAGIVVRSAAETQQITGYRAAAALRGKQAEFDAFVEGGSSLSVLRSMAESYVTTTSVPISGVALQPLQSSAAQRSAGELVTFETAVSAQRSGGGDATNKLADALAELIKR